MTFAMRKQIQAEYGKADLDRRIDEYEQKKTEKELKIIQLKSKLDAIEKRDLERREIDAKKRAEDLQFI